MRVALGSMRVDPEMLSVFSLLLPAGRPRCRCRSWIPGFSLPFFSIFLFIY
jgi:hypothetical protein